MLWMYVGFVAVVLGLLALDLGVFHRDAHVIRVKEALRWSAMWIGLGLAFTGFVYLGYEHHWLGLGLTPDAMADDPVDGVYHDGSSAALSYVTGYLVEKSLSIDNLFVIALVFTAFGVPARAQHRVLFWGVLGALVMRGIMIAVGASLIRELAWIVYVFGGFLIFTGVKMLVAGETQVDPNRNLVARMLRRVLPVTEGLHGEKLFHRAGRAGRLMVTPLFVALLVVEITDVIFAVDSIPAVFAITTDPFLVFTSNVFAILGLRSLFFALAGTLDTFRYLKVALAVVLVVVGVKMSAHSWLHQILGDHANLIMLGVVLAILAIGMAASLWARRVEERAAAAG